MNTSKPANPDSTRNGRDGIVSILGVPVSAINMEDALGRIGRWAGSGETRYVCVPDSYNIMLATRDAAHRRILAEADMVTPDGQPLVWMGRLRGHRGMDRVSGIDLMPAVCARSLKTGWRHYFYGGGPGVAEALAGRLKERFPGLDVAGIDAPPFRPLSEAETAQALGRIMASGADIVWVGLGCPKQERWMHGHTARLPGKVLIGVGAAFDIHAGRMPRAPEWMRRRGLESVFRLTREPRRLWRRYILHARRLVIAGLAESLLIAAGLRRERPAGAGPTPPHEVEYGVKP